MRALPLILSTAAALVLARPLLSVPARERPSARELPRDAAIPCPLGLLIPAAALVALIPLALLERACLTATRSRSRACTSCCRWRRSGLADDAYAGPSRGWRGHGAAALQGSFSTGGLKAVGTLGLALAWSALTQDDAATFLLAAAVLVLATNLFNLLDLRPGRSVKAFVLLGAGLHARRAGHDAAAGPRHLDRPDPRRRGARPARAGHARRHRLQRHRRRRGHLARAHPRRDRPGDRRRACSSHSPLYGELRSINTLVERAPGLRHLDSLGRTNRA